MADNTSKTLNTGGNAAGFVGEGLFKRRNGSEFGEQPQYLQNNGSSRNFNG